MSYFTGGIHAIASTLAAFYGILYSCDGYEKGVTPINNYNCLSNPKDVHYKIVLFSATYLVYDFIIYFGLVGPKGNLARQTFVHHVVGATGMYITMYTKGVPVVFTVISLVIEASSFFVNLRWFTFEFKIKSLIWPVINSSLLFLSYFAFRIIF